MATVRSGSTGKKRMTRWIRTKAYTKAQLRASWSRVKGAFWPVQISAFFSVISWVICRYGLGEQNPIFAPIATFLCLGFTRNRTVRKVIEIGLGASFGVLIGDVFVSFFGFGWWQLWILMATTPLIGRMIDRSDLTTFQTCINSIVVASMIDVATATTVEPISFDRWNNAIVGASVALIATLILPTDPTSRPRRQTALALEELANGLNALAKALKSGDLDDLANSRGYLKAVREAIDEGKTSLRSGQQTAAVNPIARKYSADLAELDRMLVLAGRMHITLSMIDRQARGMIQESGAMPAIAPLFVRTAEIIDRVSDGVEVWKRPTSARDDALQLGAELAPSEITDPEDWRSSTLVSLLRALVVDTLQLAGLSNAQARSMLAENQELDVEHTPPVLSPNDQPSDLWGTEVLPAVEPPDTAEENGDAVSDDAPQEDRPKPADVAEHLVKD